MKITAIKQSLLELDELVSKIGSKYESDHRLWIETLRTSQRDFDICEGVTNTYSEETGTSEWVTPSIETHGSAITNVINIKPSVLNDVNNVRSELSLLINTLNNN